LPFASQHLYLTFGGPGWNDQEEWQTGLRFPLDGAATEADVALWADGAATAVEGWWTTHTLAFSSAVALGWVKVAMVGVDGDYAELSWNPQMREVTPPAAGSSSAVGLPQASLVVSYQSGFSFGYARAGRGYLPPLPTAVPSNSSGQIANADAESIRDDMVDLIGNLNSLSASVPGLGVANASIMSQVGAGTTREIQSVRVGRVVDTQRRRRSGIAEAYTATAAV